jgi:hypothetical protein
MVWRWVVITCALAACGRWHFDAFGPGVGGDGGTNGDTATDARPVITSNVVFVADTSVDPAWPDGVAASDALCTTAANAAGWQGTFVAYLSTPSVSAISRLAGARGWTRTDGTPFADTTTDLLAGRIFSTPSFDAAGQPVTSGAWVITGTSSTGAASPIGTCSSWTASGAAAGAGDASASGYGFTQAFSGSCFSGVRIYCFEIDRAVAVAAPAPPAGTYRHAFVSSPWTSGGGIASADAHCQSDAGASGLPGTYQALLATTAASPASRFNAGGAPWARLDGVPLASTAADLLSGTMLAPLNVDASGAYVTSASYGDVWTGGAWVDHVGAAPCNDWASASSGMNGELGSSAFIDSYWFNAGGQGCNVAARLFCLEP